LNCLEKVKIVTILVDVKKEEYNKEYWKGYWEKNIYEKKKSWWL